VQHDMPVRVLDIRWTESADETLAISAADTEAA
jgi:hypothetical protein